MTLTEQIQLKEYYKARLQQQLIDEGLGNLIVRGTQAVGSGIAQTGEAIQKNPRRTLGTLAAAAALGLAGVGAYKLGQQNPKTPTPSTEEVRRPDDQVRRGPSGVASWAIEPKQKSRTISPR